MSNTIQPYNLTAQNFNWTTQSSETKYISLNTCNRFYPEGAFMTFGTPSTPFATLSTLFTAVPLVRSAYLTVKGSRMGLVAGLVYNTLVTCFSHFVATGFRNLAIDLAQGRDVNWKKAFFLSEQDEFAQSGNITTPLEALSQALELGNAVSLLRTMANEGWSTYHEITPVEEKLKDIKVSELISNFKLFQDYQSRLVASEQLREQLMGTRTALENSEKFTNFFEDILYQIGFIFTKIDQAPYYNFNFEGLQIDQTKLEGAYARMREFFIQDNYYSFVSFDKIPELLSEINKIDASKITFSDPDKTFFIFSNMLKKFLSIFHHNHVNKEDWKKNLGSHSQSISQWGSKFDAFLSQNPSFATRVSTEDGKRQLLEEFKNWEALKKLRNAQSLSEYGEAAVIGERKESWYNRMWGERNPLDRGFKIFEFVNLILNFEGFIENQYDFSKELRSACIEQVALNMNRRV